MTREAHRLEIQGSCTMSQDKLHDKLPPEPQVQNDCRQQQKACSSRPSLSWYVAITLGLLAAILMSLLIFRWTVGQGSVSSTCASCPSCPDFWLKYGNYCYYISVEQKDWNASQEFCLAEDSHLLILSNNQEMHRLKHILSSDFLWVGLRRNSSWRWENGSDLNFFRVVSNSLVQTCGAINKNGFQASSCEVPLQWICKKVRL